jgi:periplasmic copper chaperone A
MKNILTDIGAAFALALASTGAAFAHASFETPQAAQNSYYKAVVQIPHGCDGEATLKVHVEIPEGVIAVKPMPKAGWTLETVNGDFANSYEVHGKPVTSGVKEIIWTGSLEDAHFDQFVFQARITDTLPADKMVFFPTRQECANGKVEWTEIPAEGQDPHSLSRPAPGILVLAASDSHGHGHGAAHSAEVKAGDLVIAAPTIKATPPNAPVSGGYLAIRNDGKESDRLVSGSADFAGKVEIHEMVMDGDVMKMRPVEGGLEIPAGGMVELKPGGLHVMFMGLKEQMKPGEKRKATLVFEKAGAVEIEFDVMEIQGGHGGHDAHGSHGKQGMNHQIPGDDAGTIQMLMKAQFETPESPLAVEPVVVSGDWAVAGWSQEGRGGRGLLKKGANGWYIHMCGGEGFKHAENLAKTGMPQETAMTIAAELAAAEEKLGSEAIARFDSFEGIVEVGPAGHGHGHGAHGAHGKQGG